MKKKISSVDVAKEAGVSRATVSYVLNNVYDVKLKDETREKVLNAARKLGYFPNFTAQALKTNKCMSIGIVSRRKVDEFRFVNILGGIQPVLSQNGYSIVLCSSEADEEGFPEYYKLYKSNKIDGVIFISYQEQVKLENIEEHVKLVIEENIPSVFVDYHINNPQVNCIDIDYFQGAYMMTKYIIEKGYKKIALFIPETNSEQENQRKNGAKKAAAENSDIDFNIIKQPKSKNIEGIIKSIILHKRYNALIVAWIYTALKVLNIANKEGISVPKDIAIAALAANGFEKYSYPGLTTCNLSLSTVGKKSAELLINMLDSTSDIVNLKVPCILEERDTTMNN